MGLDHGADIRHAVESPSEGLHLGQIDSGSRNHLQGVIHLHVCRRETQHPAILLARNDHAPKGVLIAEHGRGRLHVTCRQCLSDARGTYSAGLRRHKRRYHYDIHPQTLRHRPDLIWLKIVGAQTIVIAEQHCTSAQLPANDVAQVLARSHGREFTREIQNLNPVHPESAEHLLFLFGGRKQPQTARILLQHSAGVIRKSNDNRLLFPFAGRGDECHYNPAVSGVDTVEKACGHYSHFTRGKSCL